jgi:tRNA(Arg) A34 adenosine deaminase TadA
VTATDGARPDAGWLAEVIAAAVENVHAGGGPFAAIVVREGAEVGRGANRVTLDNDPTAHAEVVALRDAGRRLGDFRLAGCVLVCSCEPCPMCLGAALWAGVDRVIYAADRDDAAAGGFADREFYELFGMPRTRWPMRVTHVAVADAAAPFASWQAQPGRVAY